VTPGGAPLLAAERRTVPTPKQLPGKPRISDSGRKVQRGAAGRRLQHMRGRSRQPRSGCGRGQKRPNGRLGQRPNVLGPPSQSPKRAYETSWPGVPRVKWHVWALISGELHAAVCNYYLLTTRVCSLGVFAPTLASVKDLEALLAEVLHTALSTVTCSSGPLAGPSIMLHGLPSGCPLLAGCCPPCGPRCPPMAGQGREAQGWR
jgi:hypothetical protein